VKKSRLLIEEWPFDKNYQYIFNFDEVVKGQDNSPDDAFPEPENNEDPPGKKKT
jgi:hypothetical protein